MKTPFVRSTLLACLTALLLSAGAPPVWADEPEPVVTTIFGERVLLFMENPRLVRGEPARFLAHLTVLETGEPVRSGSFSLRVGATSMTVSAPKRDGLFTPVGAFPEAGRWPVTLSINSDQVVESVDLGLMDVFLDRAAAWADAEADAADEVSGSVPFLLEQQWQLKLLLAEAGPRRLVRRLVVPAQVLTAEGASALVSAPAAGRLLAAGQGGFPRTGQAVQAGQELALLEPPISAADAAQLRALELEFDLRALEIERERAEALTRKRFAESEHARFAKLRPSGLATQQQLAQADRDLALAAGAIDAADAAQVALNELLERRARAPVSADGAPRFRLSAPIAGRIVSTGRVLGESVQAGDPVFRIVDPDQLWIEGQVSEFDLTQLQAAGSALASFPGMQGLRVEVLPLGAPGLFLMGTEIDPRSRTLALAAGLPNTEARFRPGMLAELEIAVDSVDAAVAIPTEALVMDGGLPTVYVMLSGEQFVRRSVELGQVDGSWVQVLAGVSAGERVATRGANTLRLASLSPSSFGSGHAH